MLIEDRLDSV
ncbi:Hypothetical protein LLA12_01866 [Lactococcus lactis subsp. lactis]|nr:Hypothetical protein LLA12_01866 [Lactococcus lactis subsp. lactis]